MSEPGASWLNSDGSDFDIDALPPSSPRTVLIAPVPYPLAGMGQTTSVGAFPVG
jgi:hypothetical protein